MKRIDHLNIEVTNKCNQNCFYCFNNSGTDVKSEFFPAIKWLDILNSLKSNGLKSVHFTGGEPFIYPEIMQLIKGSLDLGISTSVLSNGYKIKTLSTEQPEILSKLSVAQISMDSVNPEIHNKRRNYNYAWQDANDAIHALKILNIPVEISSTIDDENLQSIKGLAEYAQINNVSLLIRPIINKGRAESISISQNLTKKIENEIAEIKDIINIKFVKDRFNYLPNDKICEKYINKTISISNFQEKLKGLLNNAAIY